MIDAVLFDWGGTLTPMHDIDLLALWSAAARALGTGDALSTGGALPVEQTDALAAALLAAENDAWQQVSGTLRSFTTDELLRTAAAAAGVSPQTAGFELAAAAYRQQWAPYVAARPEARQVLLDLRATGLRTGLLSNTHWPREWHEDALAADGLLDLLDARVYTSELTHMKPHPSAFEAVMTAVGTAPERAVFVGDRRHDDISGAQALGLRTVWIRNPLVPAYDVVPDATVDSLSELPAIVADWQA